MESAKEAETLSGPKGPLVTPPNYAMVESGVHRSGTPKSEHLSFLLSLNLKTVISLTSIEMISADQRAFYEENNIRLLSYDLGRGNRKHNTHTDRDMCRQALKSLMKEENRPILVHCKKGKHRTGSVIGLLRKHRNWSYANIFAEYCSFEPKEKSREEDERFIENMELFVPLE